MKSHDLLGTYSELAAREHVRAPLGAPGKFCLVIGNFVHAQPARCSVEGG